jgi:hypothetical protein
MRIEKKYRIERCSEQGEGYRPALSYVNVTTFNGVDVAIAANGFIAAVVPVQMDDSDVAGLVHWSAFRYARKLPLSSSGSVHMTLGPDTVEFSNGWSAPRTAHPNFGALKFPDINPLIARARSASAPCFGVDPDLLKRVAEAIGYDPCTSALHIHRDSPTGPLLLALKYEADVPTPPFALVMPLHLSDIPRLSDRPQETVEPPKKRRAKAA